MDEQTWRVVDALLEQALELPPDLRAQWLQRLPEQHRSLKPTLDRLLARASAVETGDWFNTLPRADRSEPACDSIEAGTVLGPYLLEKRIGRGGMGQVWLAQRTDGLIERKVALKLPRVLAHDASLAARMARERSVLSALEHPHIARLYDAGVSPQGQPYLALEYVAGTPITDYCRDRELDVRARLNLFLQVADAVAYAHARLIVHRDLKPHNILVTDQGRAMLLDFGIAKILEDGTDRGETQFSGAMFTPDYASPEQVKGEPITVAADVYSLGVVLYELLTDERPYRLGGGGAAQLSRALQAITIVKPSDRVADAERARRLHGDLDTIVMVALGFEIGDRYAGVNELSADVRRHLSGFPIAARPDGMTYHLTRFVRRHWMGVTSSVAVIAAVVLGALVSLWQAREAVQERDRAERIRQFTTSILQDADPYVTGRAMTVEDLLEQAVKRLDAEPDMAPETRIELMTVLAAGLANLQSFDRAEPLARRTVDEATRLLGAEHLLTLQARTLLLGVLGPGGGLPDLRDEVIALESLILGHPQATPQLIVGALSNRTYLALAEGDLDTAVRYAKLAFDQSRELLGEGEPRTLTAAVLLATAYRNQRDVENTLKASAEAYRLSQAVDPLSATARDAAMMYGMALAETRRYDESLPLMTAAIERAREVLGGDAQVIGFYLGHLARYQGRAGQLRDARASYAESLPIIVASFGENSNNHRAMLSNLVRILLAGRWAEDALRQAEALSEVVAGLASATDLQRARAALCLAAAEIYAGRPQLALERLESGLTVPDDPARSGTYLDGHYVRAMAYRALGDHQRALDHLARSMTVGGESKNGTAAASGGGPELMTEMGLNYLALDRLEEARQSLSSSLEGYDRRRSQVTPRHADALEGLARALLRSGQPETALPLAERARDFWHAHLSDSPWAELTAQTLADARRALSEQG